MDPARLAELRRSYELAGLAEADLAADPTTQLARWLADAIRAQLPEPNAMVFATASPDGQPSGRTVLLKHLDERGLVLFTNYGSRKAREVAANPRASCVFPWFAMERQVVVVGAVERTSREESTAYFRSRPRGSQLGAWASEQSAVIVSREVLERRYADLAARWPPGAEIPVPEFWGGLRVVPESVEFWQGRPSRMHDRLRYQRVAVSSAPAERAAGWVVERLAP